MKTKLILTIPSENRCSECDFLTTKEICFGSREFGEVEDRYVCRVFDKILEETLQGNPLKCFECKHYSKNIEMYSFEVEKLYYEFLSSGECELCGSQRCDQSIEWMRGCQKWQSFLIDNINNL